VCNGGTKLRQYITPESYDHRDWSGDFEHTDIRAEYSDGTAVREKDGRRTDAKLRGDFDGRIRAKKDKRRSQRRRAEGRETLFFDQK